MWSPSVTQENALPIGGYDISLGERTNLSNVRSRRGLDAITVLWRVLQLPHPLPCNAPGRDCEADGSWKEYQCDWKLHRQPTPEFSRAAKRLPLEELLPVIRY